MTAPAKSDEEDEGNELLHSASKMAQNSYPLQSPVSIKILDQFKELLIAFKIRQDEEKASSESREQLARELSRAKSKINELTKALERKDNKVTALEPLHQFYEMILTDGPGNLATPHPLDDTLPTLQSELAIVRDENLSLQHQIEAAKAVTNQEIAAANAFQNELKITISQEAAAKEAALNQVQAVLLQRDHLQDQLQQLQQKLDFQAAHSQATAEIDQESYPSIDPSPAAIDENRPIFDALINEVAAIKHNLVQSLREAKELEAHYLGAVKEKAVALNQFSQLQRTADKQCLEIEKVKGQCKELLTSAQSEKIRFSNQIFDLQHSLSEMQAAHQLSQEENSELKLQIAQLQSHAAAMHKEMQDFQEEHLFTKEELHSHEQSILEKEIMIKDLLDRLMRVEEEKIRTYEELDACRLELVEKEQHFDEAQQHLAKKLRETALLDSEIEKLNEQAKTSAASFGLIENFNAELKIKLQKSVDQQIQLEERVHSLMREIEQWQGKHTDLSLKWQSAAKQIEELQKISERHQQLQHMVSNFGHLLGMPLDNPQISSPPSPLKETSTSPLVKSTATSLPSDIEDEKSSHEKDQMGLFQNLFDMSKKSTASKRDLFE